MNPGKAAALSLTALLVAAPGSALWSDSAEARPGGHYRHGFRHHNHGARLLFFAAPLFVPRYYTPAPAYYAPPPPPVYIEQPQPQPQAYWYYCASAGAYYPHVQSCPEGWQRVAPQPPPG